MVATGFLSMFMANIPTTAMMIPVVDAIIDELQSRIQEPTDIQSVECGPAISGNDTDESVSERVGLKSWPLYRSF